jgi:hypothetical protein
VYAGHRRPGGLSGGGHAVNREGRGSSVQTDLGAEMKSKKKKIFLNKIKKGWKKKK